MKKKKIVSSICPKGELNFGQMLGQVSKLTALQADHQCFFAISNYEAMVAVSKPEKLYNDTWATILGLISCGIDPGNIFLESAIPEPAVLSWIFSCLPSRNSLPATVHPGLRDASLLMYHADMVAASTCWKTRIETVRCLAQGFNDQYNVPYFIVPEYIPTEIPSNTYSVDPAVKTCLWNQISVFDEEEEIRQKIRITVASENIEIDPAPRVARILNTIQIAGQESVCRSLQKDFERGVLNFVHIENVLADTFIEMTREFRRNRKCYDLNRDAVEKRIRNSSAEIQQFAKRTLREVQEIVGLSEPATRYWRT
ncbi:MAG: hypothetical protein M3O71_15420 [Bacteroidota bacterium]|nr:hypothetical protein [Bacteroidota bacterium]